MSSYSNKTLSDKLGIKAGFKIYIENAVENIFDLLAPFPENINLKEAPSKGINLMIYFIREKEVFYPRIKYLYKLITGNGAIWICWKKGRGKVKSDISENEIRDYILPLNLVDVKVCSIDQNWSGLKFVLRKDLRIINA